MQHENKPRFTSVAAALRFYFRVRVLLEGTDHRRRRPRQPLRVIGSGTGGAIEDFLSVAACVDELDDFEFWMLAELYGPTCFDPRQRTVSRALELARRTFPEREVTSHGMRRLRRATLALLGRRLKDLGLIPVGNGSQRSEAASRGRAGRIDSMRARERGRAAANHH
jgi:hypothetical protein